MHYLKKTVTPVQDLIQTTAIFSVCRPTPDNKLHLAEAEIFELELV